MASVSSSTDSDFTWSEIPSETSLIDWGTASKIICLKVASVLTDPICKVREYFYCLHTLNETCKRTIEKVARIALLVLGIVLCALLTPVTAPIGAALRGIVASVQSKPFIYIKRPGEGKVLPENLKITFVSHNECYMPGGYSITDGQVTPPSDKGRMDGNLERIKRLNPDLVCLYEVPDICDANYISSRLADYPFIIPVAGVRAVGPSSMMYVASKYEIIEDSIEFVPFIKGEEVTGRAQFSEKGYLSFDIKSRGEKGAFATFFSTHLQHSEIPSSPTADEIRSRSLQLKKIAGAIQQKVDQGLSVFFTGDLNLSESELAPFLQKQQIQWLRDPSIEGIPTWGGDSWCARLSGGKPPSAPEVLDYAFGAGRVKGLWTEIHKMGFSGLEFRPNAGSDHELLFTTAEVG